MKARKRKEKKAWKSTKEILSSKPEKARKSMSNEILSSKPDATDNNNQIAIQMKPDPVESAIQMIRRMKLDASDNNDEFAVQASSCPPPLIPGLPEDLAQICLARVPWIRLATQMTVCKTWASYIRSDDFFGFRSHLQLSAESLLVVVSVEKVMVINDPGNSCEDRLVVSVYDPKASHKRLAVSVQPFEWKYCLSGFRCAIIGTDLFIIGGSQHGCNVGKKGWHPGCVCDGTSSLTDWTTRNNVWRFNFVSTTWTSAAPMHFARSDFACAVVDGKKICVAGGVTHGGGGPGYSAEMYDYKEDRWDVLPHLHASPGRCLGVALEDRFYVVGSDYFSEIFDVGKGQWYAINNMWQSKKLPLALASFDDSLYAIVPPLVDCDDFYFLKPYPTMLCPTMLKSYDEYLNQWNDVMRLKIKGNRRGNELIGLSGQGLFWMKYTLSHPRRLNFKVGTWVSSANDVEIHHPSLSITSSLRKVIGSGIVCI